MKQKIKLIGLDMDGTILNDDMKLTTYTRNVLETAIAQDIEVAAISGRPLTALHKEFLEIPGVRFSLSANGARIQDMITNKPVHVDMISQDTLLRLMELFSNYDSMPEVYIDGQTYLNEEFYPDLEKYFRNLLFANFFRKTRKFVPNARDLILQCPDGMEKIDALFSSTEDQADCLEHILADFPDVQVSCTGYGLEITKKGSNKGAGLLKLAEVLGIKQEETLAIGDADNDLDMIKAAGIGIAMVNGEEHLKKIADYISEEDNNHDGAAKMLEKFALDLE